ncbi:MAG: Gfo/Idh/MocA family protein [Planctomycetota bacterium]
MLQMAVIGCGVIGPTHAAAIALDARCTLRWACDLDPQRARKRIEAQHHCSDHRWILDDPDCHAVAICTPHPQHVAIAQQALAAGKHVICEKPLGVHPHAIHELVLGTG